MPDVDVRSGDRPLRGYLARPAEPGPWPGVVVLHEAFGLDAVMRRQADRMAAAGYLALAPDLYSAGGAARCLVATMTALLRGRGAALVDIDAARAWLAAAAECTGRIGVLGFCMGGGFALLTANTGFDAASVNYGVLPRDPAAALAGACPVIGSYAGRDPMLRGAAEKLRGALDRAGVPGDVKEYPRAGHSFLNDAPAGPRLTHPLQRIAGVGPEPAAAADAWQRIEAFFATHLT